MESLESVRALTFDLFGTILDLGGSLTPPLAPFLQSLAADVAPNVFWSQWRDRQRIEQYQDSLMMLGHSGYLETARRALVHTLRRNRVKFSETDVAAFMQNWHQLSPFADVAPALERLRNRYKLVVLSNGEPHFVDDLLANRVASKFDDAFSVNSVGSFKPHPAVYRAAAVHLGLEPQQILMVSAHAFDAIGARACGFRAVYVNRYDLPVDDHRCQPDATVNDFGELADVLLA